LKKKRKGRYYGLDFLVILTLPEKQRKGLKLNIEIAGTRGWLISSTKKRPHPAPQKPSTTPGVFFVFVA